MPFNGGSHKRRNNKTQLFNSVPNSDMTSVSSPYKWWARVGVTALLFSFILLFGISSNTWFAPRNSLNNSQLPPVYTVEIVNEFPHDHDAFTQGLLYWGNDTLYESTGLYGQSTVRKVALQTGKVETQYKMDQSIFGEGLTLLEERLYQVTWLQKTGFIYERDNFNNVTTFTHHMKDGWGLTTDGKTLFGSDGSSILYQMDPKTMEVIQKQKVMYEGGEVRYLNELEFINGEVWANIFGADCIVRLSPGGTVVGWVLLPNLRETLIQEGEMVFDVLNGIAWDSDKQRIFVTGKLWPKLYEIKLHPMKEHSQVNIQQLCMPNLDFHL
ncbi:glutaminyl-peptide cyclotransferase [Silene latifolia]|uniref:glutaminyl-peptide cyclotransferase n=1 Tax=Silene latifolia TaxID=37657 RepID=UPI003D771E5D